MFIAGILFSSPAHSACSSYIGEATLNEVYSLGGDQFVEIKILGDIDSSVYDDWSIQICDKGGCSSYSVSTASLYFPYLVIENVDHIDLSNNGEMDVTLLDASGDAIDYLSVNSALYQDPSCSSFLYPTSVTTDSDLKGIYRYPDGTGAWAQVEDSGAGGEPSEGEDNTGPEYAIGGFNAYEQNTAAGSVEGVIETKVAGTSFILDVIAVNDKGDAVLTNYNKQVRIDLLDASDNSVPFDANGCRSTWSVIQTVTPDPEFTNADNGRISVTFQENEAWRDVRVQITSLTGPTKRGCSNNNFAIRPAALVVSATDLDWQTAGTTRTLNNISETGVTLHKAGRSFTLQAEAVNSSGATTTNYAGEPADSILSQCGTLACPATLDLGTLSTGAWSPSSGGTVLTNTATYNEVGAFNLVLKDRTFADVDIDDTAEADRYIQSNLLNVGRFVPDHFLLAATNTPEFLTFNDAICATRSFTYIGQAFGYATEPVIGITARNASGGTTTNYAGDLWKITETDVDQTYSASNSLDTGLIKLPTVTSNGNGTGTITPNGSDLLAFTRNGTVAPFDADISLAVSVTDADGVDDNGDAVFDGGGIGISFDSGNEFRFGRLVLRNAFGPEILPLTIPLLAEYYDGSAFMPNSADYCTGYDATGGNLSLTAYYPQLNEGETTPDGAGTLISGQYDPANPMFLTAPGETNHGSADLSLGVDNWLRFDWDGIDQNSDGDLNDDDPAARATFGIYKGNPRVIYMREVY